MEFCRQLLLMLVALGGCRPTLRTDVPNMQRSEGTPSCTLRSIVPTASGQLDIELYGTDFPVQNELPTLRIGSVASRLSRYPDSGDTQHLIFTFERAELAAIPSGAAVQLWYGDADDARRIPCGLFDRRLLR